MNDQMLFFSETMHAQSAKTTKSG